MYIISYAISDSLYLVHNHVSDPDSNVAAPVDIPTNHVVVIDCSGSMSGDLPKIREQLKRKLPKLLGEKDTISIVWFSGRNQFGVLLEAEPVATLADLKDVNAAIDRWLRPIGLTGFRDPLVECTTLVARVAKKKPGTIFSLFFMSDGCDNEWSRPDILKAVEQTSPGFSSATFVEYGYYADRSLLTAMAEKAGGVLIFAEDFDKFAPSFDAAMQKKVLSAPRIQYKIKGDPVGGFAFSCDGDDFLTFSIDKDYVSIPEHVRDLFYVSPTMVGKLGVRPQDITQAATKQKPAPDQEIVISALYAAVSLFSVRMKPTVVLPLLKSLGDVQFIEAFGQCFGKQKYSDFMQAAQQAALGHGRFVKGWDPKKVPRDDAFTVLDLLKILAENDESRILLDHPEFKYSRIGRGRLDSSEHLTADELEEIRQLTTQIATEKDAKKISGFNERIAAITAAKVPALRFEADPQPNGYPIANLTYNEDRPNISVLVRKEGTVDVSTRLDASLQGKVGPKLPTFIWRNYAIVKDGLVNVDTLPVLVSDTVLRKIRSQSPETVKSQSPSDSDPAKFVVTLDLRQLPVINRNMVKNVSAKTFFELQYELVKSQAAQKVYNHFSKELLPAKKSDGFVGQYGQAAADWLREQGITEYSGFAPKVIQAESKDFYLGKELKVSLKGFSKLPSVKELIEQIAKGKINAPGALMKPIYDEVSAFLSSDIYKKSADQPRVLEAWLDGQTKHTRRRTRELIFDVAQTTFSLIVGQVWFSEFQSLEENSMSFDIDGQRIEAKANLIDVEIKI